MAALADCEPDRIKGIGKPIRQRLRTQAKLQIESHGAARPKWVATPPSPDEPRRGLALLPPPSPQDIFFDLEGFPFAEGGLEYLFGACVSAAPEPDFHDWWAHDEHEERLAFEGFIDWAMERWRQDPAMHIYHYADYEKSALRRLMGKYGTREDEVDELLRQDVLVDLFKVVRQGFLVGTPSYSLKDVEHLFRDVREGAVTSAGGSVVEYQRWIDSGEPRTWADSPVLAGIRDYNRIDCESTLLLRNWLLDRRAESQVAYLPRDRDTAGSPSTEPAQRETTPTERCAQELQSVADAHLSSDPERARVAQLLAWVLEFHRREEKPMWWRFFDRHAMSEQEVCDDPECLGGLVRTERAPAPHKKSILVEYRFDPEQDTKLAQGDKCILLGDPQDSRQRELVRLDREAGLLELKLSAKDNPPDRVGLAPHGHVPADALKAAIVRYASAWLAGAPLGSALDDLLFRRPPKLRGHPGGPLIAGPGVFLDQMISLAERLDGTTLCIQGPPGTGKTFTAAAMISALVPSGKRVGVMANSHKAILNLLSAARAADNWPQNGRLYKAGSSKDPDSAIPDLCTVATAEVADLLNGSGLVVGGTAWLFSREELDGKFDYLFVDEAGQVSLANTVAVGACARNLVLVGDQMQLAQPVQGSHPGESGKSCLEYALNGSHTSPRTAASFSAKRDGCTPISVESFRMPSTTAVCKSSDHGGAGHSGLAPGCLVPRESGIVFIPVKHTGCEQWSLEEVDVIERVVDELKQRTVVGQDGSARPLELDDILFVAPFNMQVRRLTERLGPSARIGSVDRFQGQEAPVVIISMCASDLESAPRGAAFLLERNRLNVAVSRAQALAIIVASPELMAARCSSIEEMRLVNLLCRFARAG